MSPSLAVACAVLARALVAPAPAVLDVYDGRQCSLAAVGDMDADAQPDFVVRLDARDGPARFVLVSGRDGHVVRELVTDGFEPGFGNSFAASSDLDGDGRPELLLARLASRASGSQWGELRLELRSGQAGLPRIWSCHPRMASSPR